jgi:hypothetical protein
MGLGAIAEERGQWDEAIQQYGALIQDANVPGVYKTQAAQRTQLVNQIRHPLFMGVPATAPTTEPSDQEIIPEVPDRLPSTQPASMPG